MTLRPLTKTSSTGEVYTRFQHVEAEIRESLSMTPSEVSSRIRAVGYGSEDGGHRRRSYYLSAEALVYLTRHHREAAVRTASSDPHLARLHAQAEGLAAGAAVAEMQDVAARRLDILPASLQEGAWDKLQRWFLSLLFDTSEKGDPLEVAFGVLVKRRAITFAKRARSGGDAATQPRTDHADDDPFDPVETDPHIEAQAIRDDTHQEWWDALDALPDKIRIPFTLNKLEGVPVQSSKPGERTLVDELGLSHTTIYNRIREAQQRLRYALNDDASD